MTNMGEINSPEEEVEEPYNGQYEYIYLIVERDGAPPEVKRYVANGSAAEICDNLEKDSDINKFKINIYAQQAFDNQVIKLQSVNRLHQTITFNKLSYMYKIKNVWLLKVEDDTTDLKVTLTFHTPCLPLTWSSTINRNEKIENLYKMVQEYYGCKTDEFYIRIVNESTMAELRLPHTNETIEMIIQKFNLGIVWNVQIIFVKADIDMCYFIKSNNYTLIAQNIKAPIYVVIMKDDIVSTNQEEQAILLPVEGLNVHSTVNELSLKVIEFCEEQCQNFVIKLIHFLPNCKNVVISLPSSSTEHLWEICKEYGLGNTWFVKVSKSNSIQTTKSDFVEDLELPLSSKNNEESQNKDKIYTQICLIVLCQDLEPIILWKDTKDCIKNISFYALDLSLDHDSVSVFAQEQSSTNFIEHKMKTDSNFVTLGDILAYYDIKNIWFVRQNKQTNINLKFILPAMSKYISTINFNSKVDHLYEIMANSPGYGDMKDAVWDDICLQLNTKTSKYTLENKSKTISEIVQELDTGPVWALYMNEHDIATYNSKIYIVCIEDNTNLVLLKTISKDSSLTDLFRLIEKEYYSSKYCEVLCLTLCFNILGNTSKCQLKRSNETLETVSKKFNLGNTWFVQYCKTSANSTSELPLPQSTKHTGYVGLVNQAMTCYLNSLLQTLYMTPEFRNGLYNWVYIPISEKDDKSDSIPYQLKKLFLNLQISTKNAVETTELTKSFGWDSSEAWHQHDIQELCRVMFDALEHKFKNTQSADLINKLYAGKMRDYVKCLECDTVKSREDTFLDIPLPLRSFDNSEAYKSVEEALRAFVKPEKLDGNNQYMCEKCNKQCDAHKGLTFSKFPYLLTLHLLRFEFDYNTLHRIKLNDKLTFPDILDLNSFIDSSDNEEYNHVEEDSASIIKGDDRSTTDSGTHNDEGLSSSSITSNCTHSLNQDHDDDEGVDLLSATASTSSCNHHSERNHVPYVSPEAPYVYELFSIMIHSGSASGGHYYAYIKDFETQEWMCFNDTSVSKITQEHIQKSYGGDHWRPCYSGAYATSTNAYMLMYRQIDKKRNVSFMSQKDFPDHVKELVKRITENEENDRQTAAIRCRSMLDRGTMGYRNGSHAEPTRSVKVTYKEESKLFDMSLKCTWSQLLTIASNHFLKPSFACDNLCQLRLIYNAKGSIDVFDGRESGLVNDILKNYDDTAIKIVLDVCNPSTRKNYTQDILTDLYIVEVTDKGVDIVDGPFGIPINITETVKAYKAKASGYVKMKQSDMELISAGPKGLNHFDDDEKTLVASHLIYFITSAYDVDPSKSFHDSMLYKFKGTFPNIITIDVQYCDTTEEMLDEMKIPVLEKYNRVEDKNGIVTSTKRQGEVTSMVASDCKILHPVISPVNDLDISSAVSKNRSSNSTNGENMFNDDFANGMRKESSDELLPLRIKYSLEEEGSPPFTLHSGKDWEPFAREQSNSEDSSLSDSDRTLVGDPPEEPSTAISEEEVFGVSCDTWDNEELESPENEEQNDFDDKYYFSIRTKQEDQVPGVIKIILDKRTSLYKLKRRLEPLIGIPYAYFDIISRELENQSSKLHQNLGLRAINDDTKFKIVLKRKLRVGERYVKIYYLRLQETQPFRYLFECALKPRTSVSDAKRDILAQMEKTYDESISYEMCRLRSKDGCNAMKVYLDDQVIDCATDLCIQKLLKPEPVCSSDQIIVFVRQWSLKKDELGLLEELVFDKNEFSIEALKKELERTTEIPEEFIVIEKAPMSIQDSNLRITSIKTAMMKATNNGCCIKEVTDGEYFIYKDTREEAVSNENGEELRPAQPVDLRGKSRRAERGLTIKFNNV